MVVLRHVQIAWAMRRGSQTVMPRVARPRSVASLPLASGTWSHDYVVKARVLRLRAGVVRSDRIHQLRTNGQRCQADEME